MTGGRRARLLAGALGLAVAAGPGASLAALSPVEKGASVSAELSRLDAVRERLDRRRALEAALTQRVAGLAGEIDALQRRREQTWAVLHDERDQARGLERRLDRLVPRVLARSAAVRERRERAARLLAELASTSRQAQLDPTLRARMLAISPLMLRRLQSAESGLAVVELQPDQLIARYHAVERRAPLLMAEGQRLQRQREQTQRQRQAVIAQLAQASAQVRALSAEQQRLAALVLSSEAAQVARAGPRADQPALPDRAPRAAGAVTPDAAVKGMIAPQPQLAFAADAVQPAVSQLLAALSDSLATRPPDATAYGDFPAVAPPPAKPLDAALKAGLEDPLTGMPDGLATPLDVVFLEPEGLAGIPSRVASARLQRRDLDDVLPGDSFSRVTPARLQHPQAPILPVPGEVVNPFSDQGGTGTSAPGIRIVAAPGQAVAAPEDGRVVFAGPFKSYGLLLIIEHQREYHTLLWGFSTLEVDVGDRIRTGQIVGVMAADVASAPELHVEVRRNGRPVNPLPWLAASSNKVRG